MLLASAYKASDSDHRRLHNTQLPVAGQAGTVAQQKRHGACNLSGGLSILSGISIRMQKGGGSGAVWPTGAWRGFGRNHTILQDCALRHLWKHNKTYTECFSIGRGVLVFIGAYTAKYYLHMFQEQQIGIYEKYCSD